MAWCWRDLKIFVVSNFQTTKIVRFFSFAEYLAIPAWEFSLLDLFESLVKNDICSTFPCHGDIG